VRGTFHIVLNKIKAAAARHSPYLIAIEQVQYQASIIQELARSTFLPVKGIHPSKDKITRSAPLITKYEQKLVRHDPSGVAPWFIEELLGFPDAQHDDGVDAAVYAFQAVQYNKSTPLMLKSSVL
jgi:predicted phage terminase large subunit-like protein